MVRKSIFRRRCATKGDKFWRRCARFASSDLLSFTNDYFKRRDASLFDEQSGEGKEEGGWKLGVYVLEEIWGIEGLS